MPTADEWKDWIEEKKNNRRHEYLNSAGRLVSDYNQEQQKTQEYSGRVLLELIQNANDAGRDQPNPVDIKVELTEKYLVVANTGAKFSKEGIKSLFISHNSPKQFRSDCIGYKGLGFRSILNWTSSAVILSDNLSIGFRDKYALEFLEQLCERSADIDAKVQEFQKHGQSRPIATLVAPKWVTDDEISNTALSAAYERGQQLRSQGYDTVICLALSNNDGHNAVEREIAELSEEFTLFLQHTGRIEIESPNHSVDWQIDRGDEITSIRYADGTTTKWGIVEETGEIPESDSGPGQSGTEYEIKLAIPESDAMTDRIDEPLYVFFPTKVSFPFPVLAHATFETTDDRNHLVDNATNRFVASQLVQMMARTADKLTTDNMRWEALKTVTPKGTVDSTLSQLGGKADNTSFEALLLEALRSAQVIPVYNGGFKSPEEVSKIDADFNDLLEFHSFDSVCRYPNNRTLRQQLQKLNINSLSESTLRTKVEDIQNELSIKERATIIYQLINNDLITEDPPGGLLLDSDSNPVPSESTVFLQSENELVSLPEWISQRFIHKELQSLLQDRFGESSNRRLRQALDPFPVTEYSFSGLVSSIVAEVNRRIKKNPGEELKWRQEILQILWKLYNVRKGNESFPEQLTVMLPTRTETLAPAVELYIGKEYPGGQLTEALYEPFDPSSLVAPQSKLEIDDDPAAIKKFLCWLGVADEPRQVELTDPSNEFREHILQELSYPARFRDLRFEKRSDTPSRRDRYEFEKLSTIDRLDEILEHANPNAIIAFLTTISDRLERWRRHGDKDAIFKIKPKNKQKWRQLYGQSVLSHPVWLLESTPWLPVADGKPKQPIRCSISPEIESLSPIIGYPTVDCSSPLLEQMDIDNRALNIALQHAGVTTTLEDLSWSAFYQILLHLPKIDPDGEHAERIYRMILSKNGEPTGEAYTKFQNEGLMWGRKDADQDYYPVSDLRFPESESLPSAVMEHYPIITLSTRESTAKVKTRFKVESLSMTDLHVADQEIQPHDHNESLTEDIQQLKPFIYGLRMDTIRESQDRDSIKNLQITLCESYTASAKVEGKETSIKLEPGSYLIWDDTAYLIPVQYPIEHSPLQNKDLSNIIAEIFSTQLELDIQNEIYILASSRDREKTFEVLTGGNSELLQKARSRFETPVKPQNDPPKLHPSPDTRNTGDANDGVNETANNSQDTPPESATTLNGDPSDMTIEKTEDKTVENKKVRIQRVTRKNRTSPPPSPRHVADGDQAEDICMRFEENQDRYPFNVAHIRGRDLYGCDIISFETANRREQFRNKDDPKPIDRYIEVKASTTDKDAVPLSGSQLQAARKHQERFFLYRAYEKSRDVAEYELVVLQHPLGDPEAIEPRFKINPFKAKSTDAYKLALEGRNLDSDEE